MTLKRILKSVEQILIPLGFGSSLLLAGCAVHAGVYDPYYHDRHAWAGEVTFYQQWETDTRHRHEEFNKRSSEEQREYWEWRHNQGRDHDRDHDNDRDRH